MPSQLSATSAAALVIAACLVGCDTESDESDYEAARASNAAETAARTAEDAQPPELVSEQGQKRWNQPPEMQIDTAKTYYATIKTNMGDIRLELFDDAAPKTVNNFVFLAKNDFYDGLIFHRVIDKFMIQGGDPTGTGSGGPGYTIPDEVQGNPHRHEPFTLSMAKTPAPNSGGSQFFITEGAPSHLDGVHTVFGRVVEGKEVVQKITDVEKGPQDKPVQDVTIEDVVIDEGEGDATTRPATRPAGE